MFHLKYSGLTCCQPKSEYASLKYPAPNNFYRANSFTNVLGRRPSMAYVLMSGANVASLNLDAFADLEFEFVNEIKNETQTITVKNLMLTREPQCLTPSITDSDPNSIYLLELADKRFALANPQYEQTITAAFNIHRMAGNDSMNGSYTWASMAQAVWESMPLLGTWPGLPYTPAGTPRNWQFNGSSAWLALCAILEHISCAVRYKVDTGTYDIVNVGSADAEFDGLVTTYRNLEIYNARFLAVNKPRIPETIRILFNRWYIHGGSEDTISFAANWQLNSTYSVDVPTGLSSNGIVHPLWDDQLAFTNPDGSLTSGTSSALSTVATERAAQWVQAAQVARMARRYSGLISFKTGPKCKAVSWKCGIIGSQDQGVFTETLWHPAMEYDAEADDFRSLPNEKPNFGVTWPLQAALPNVLEASGEIEQGAIVNATHKVWDQANSTWIAKESAKFMGMPDEKYMGRLIGQVGGVPLFVGQGNSWGDVYIQNIYNVQNIYVENIYVEYIEVNILNVTIINHYGCNDLVNTGVRFNFIDNIKCDDDGYYYYRLNEFKQTYDYTGCPVTTITKLGLIPFGCCDLSCVPDPPPPPWEYCCESYPDDVCGVLTKIDDGTTGSCECGNSEWVLKVTHPYPDMVLSYWGGTFTGGSTWNLYRTVDADCVWESEDGFLIINCGTGPESNCSLQAGSIVYPGNSGCLVSGDFIGIIYDEETDEGPYAVNFSISPTGSTSMTESDIPPEGEITSICLTLIDGCYVGTATLGETLYTVTICCVGTNENPLLHEVTFDDGTDTYTFQSISVQCGNNLEIDFGIINIAGSNYKFAVFVDSTGTCCDEDSSTPVGDCDPDVDHGYGQYGWTWQPEGYWLHEEGDINECTGGGIPSYPPGDGSDEWVGIHTTTYCCPPE